MGRISSYVKFELSCHTHTRRCEEQRCEEQRCEEQIEVEREEERRREREREAQLARSAAPAGRGARSFAVVPLEGAGSSCFLFFGIVLPRGNLGLFLAFLGLLLGLSWWPKAEDLGKHAHRARHDMFTHERLRL